ncbi:MAG: 2TM domain-containing protein [Flavobacterium sp.]|uniref:2TM domain-containing protein n=1 Tax=Flavobacterium sp. TaxID=239 RepID=UPI00121D9DB3|nr:2TM domain-containing protein [Flavobacterium sp.]RZJ65824.1 MAG: 2TM domain-containing protein [Flavobacterium sp.]
METPKFEKSIEYRKARKQAREIKGFYIHVMMYCLVIPILIAINLIFVPDFYWFPFSMFGWGTGLLFHAMTVYKYTPFLGRNWEDRKIQQFIEEEKAKQNKHNQN